jgi:hypothetical protein
MILLFNPRISLTRQQELAELPGSEVQLRNQRVEDDYIQEESLRFQTDIRQGHSPNDPYVHNHTCI